MAEIQAKDRLPGMAGRLFTREIPGKLDSGRERVITKDVSSLYKALMDQVEVRAWAVAIPPTGKTVIENMGAYSHVALTAHWKKNAPTILYGAGEAFVPSSYPIEMDSHKKALLLKTDRTNIAGLVRQAVANDVKAAALERIGREDFKGKAARLRLKADAAFAKAKVLEVGLKMDIRSLPHNERVPIDKAARFYRYVNVALEDAEREGRDLGNEGVDQIIQEVRRDLGLQPPKEQRLEAVANRTLKKRTISVTRGPSNTVLEAQASDILVQQAPSRSHRAINYLFLGSELGVLLGGAVACSPATPIEVPPPGANEVLISFNAEDQRAAAISVMNPWEGQTLKDGFSVSENGTFTFFREENLMLHQTNAEGEQMPGMVTLAWADAVNTSTNQTGKESFLFFMNDQGIPTQAVLLEFQPSTFENQISANLIDADGKLVGYININTDPNKTDQPFASIQYTPATAVPGNPGVEQRNVVDLTFGPGSTKDNKEEFASAFVAFATGAGSAFAASGEVISVTPTAELVTPTPAFPEVVPIGEAELSAIISKVNDELSFGYSLQANPDTTYAIASPDGQVVKNIQLRADGNFYVTENDGSLTTLPPETVFMPSEDKIYAGFDRIDIFTGEVNQISLQDTIWPGDPEHQSPRMTSAMLPLYEKWVREQLDATGELDQMFEGANKDLRWQLKERGFVKPFDINGDGSVDTYKGLELRPAGEMRSLKWKQIPMRSVPSFVTLVDKQGVSVFPLFILNANTTSRKEALFPIAIDTKAINMGKVPHNYPLRDLVGLPLPNVTYTINNEQVQLMLIINGYLFPESTVDSLGNIEMVQLYKKGVNQVEEDARMAILQEGISNGSFSGSEKHLWIASLDFASAAN